MIPLSTLRFGKHKGPAATKCSRYFRDNRQLGDFCQECFTSLRITSANAEFAVYAVGNRSSRPVSVAAVQAIDYDKTSIGVLFI